MKRLLVIVVVLAFAVPCWAQTAQPPKLGPEVQNLARFVGTWKTEGEVKVAGLFGPVGKFSGTETCEWFAGGLHVVCRSESTGPARKLTELYIFGYDAEAKAYTYYGIDSGGDSEYLKGSLTGNTWTWLWDRKAAGKPANYRFTEVDVSPTSYTFKVEYSVAGGPWIVIEDGKGT